MHPCPPTETSPSPSFGTMTPSPSPSSSTLHSKPPLRTYGKSRRPPPPSFSLSDFSTDTRSEEDEDDGDAGSGLTARGGMPELTRSSSAASTSASGLWDSSSIAAEDDDEPAIGIDEADDPPSRFDTKAKQFPRSGPGHRSIAPLPPRGRILSLPSSISSGNKPSSSSSSSSSSQSTLKSFFAPKPRVLPRVGAKLSPFTSDPASGASSTSSHIRAESCSLPPSNTITSTPTLPPKSYRQLHFRPSLSSSNTSSPNPNDLTTCKHCHLTYLPNPNRNPNSEEETSHRAHCERVVLGMVWAGQKGIARGRVIEEGVEVSGKAREGGGGKGWRGVGRVLKIEGRDLGENSQVHDILSSVDTILSAPPLPPSSLSLCNIYLFLSSSPAPPPISSSSSKRILSSSLFTAGAKSKGKGKEKERVVGVVVAEPIRWGMRVVGKGEGDEEGMGKKRKREDLVVVADGPDGVGEGNEADSGGTLC